MLPNIINDSFNYKLVGIIQKFEYSISKGGNL